MIYKIYIVEDRSLTFESYTRALGNLSILEDLGFSYKIVSTKPISLLTYYEFEQELREFQPDIIFLDYELEFKTEGRTSELMESTALDVIDILHRVYNRVNFPPFIILNTQSDVAKSKVNQAINVHQERKGFPKDFVSVLTPHSIKDKPMEVATTLREGIRLLLAERQVFDNWNRVGFKFYTYPKKEDIDSDFEIQKVFSSTVEAKKWYMAKEELITLPGINKQNLLFITLQTDFALRSNIKLGSLFTVESSNQIRICLFRFETISDVESFLADHDFDTFMRKYTRSFKNRPNICLFYNTGYLKRKVYGSQFKENCRTIQTAFIRLKDIELAAYDCDLLDHPIFYHFKDINGLVL